jgi:hypothetical protein
MWILPKQLHTLDSVQGTEALNLDLNESSQLCSQSLFVRSKHSPLRTWLQKWKRDSWSQHLYGRILKPSLGKAFETEWTSLLEVTHANHSPQQESEQERKTQDTSGLGSQMDLFSCDQDSSSSKMLKDTSALDCEKSLATWKALVTKLRGEYSARVKSARLTSASGCSSWPTCQARDWKGPQGRAYAGVSRDLPSMLEYHGPADPASPSTAGSRLESWATPRAGKTTDENPETWAKRQAAGDVATMPLTAQVKAWGTPTARDHKSGRGNEERNYKELTPMVERQQVGKLNPRWVETLMGLPVGWTMPSCTRPVTIAPTNYDCLGTESSQQPQSEHLELF